ncbi:hypothetical protein SKAU_G00191000 [Synaphobranchus kaupii]|uniref:Uncharacterized protein n=1 Tax=Synaphobranchus kaupii TaxID=118154 RepID=A0A9Q1IWV6_SYNKA|nr:hypothetical protein SKAU_G00191000 [Synaphobranchus kaupii]
MSEATRGKEVGFECASRRSELTGSIKECGLLKALPRPPRSLSQFLRLPEEWPERPVSVWKGLDHSGGHCFQPERAHSRFPTARLVFSEAGNTLPGMARGVRGSAASTSEDRSQRRSRALKADA